MLEAHVVKFIRQHKFPLGFFGEQGGESIHHEFREFADAHQSVKPPPKRLKAMLEAHYIAVHPVSRKAIPEKQSRNLKRKQMDDS